MKSLSTRSLNNTILGVLVILGIAVILSSALPRMASAAAVALVSVTATSTPAYTNTGLATTTRATTDDTVQYQLTLNGTPLIAPQINIFSMGSTTMSGSATDWFYSTTTASTWTDGLVTFQMSVGGTTGAEATTTVTQADLTGANVTFDTTGPTLDSIAWTDTDSSTQFSATDTFLLTFSETMATTTLTGADLATVLALTNSHVFSTTTAPSWNTAGTQLTITLGADTTVTGTDTVDPTSAVKDAIGIADATAAAVALPDDSSPGTPAGPTDTTNQGSLQVLITSVGSSQIRYTTDGTTPTCSVGTVYTADISISETLTLKAVGCDEADNASSVASAVYTITTASSGSGGGGGGSATPAVPATPSAASGGLSAAQIQAVLDVLASFGADASVVANVKASLEGATKGSVTSNAVAAFKSDLTVGSLGEQVRALQMLLNAKGFTVASSGPGSPGNETTTFGALTKAALIEYQKAKGITPAVGFFGPLTRAAINAEQ